MTCKKCGLVPSYSTGRCARCGARLDLEGGSPPGGPGAADAPASGSVDDRTTLRSSAALLATLVPAPAEPLLAPTPQPAVAASLPELQPWSVIPGEPSFLVPPGPTPSSTAPPPAPPTVSSTVPPPLPVSTVPPSQLGYPPVSADAVPSMAWQAPLEIRQANAHGSGEQYLARATLGSRLLAWLVDAMAIGGVIFVWLILITLLLILLAGGSPATAAVIGGLGYLVLTGMVIGYLVVLNGRGQTVGKRVLKIKVVDRDTGMAIGYGRSVLRVLMQLVMSLPCGLGYLSIPLTEEFRGWHDKAANDVVVQLPTRA
jgi:uncharacterized RDD family membrane protein YckC